jgi:hypothetical protein
VPPVNEGEAAEDRHVPPPVMQDAIVLPLEEVRRVPRKRDPCRGESNPSGSTCPILIKLAPFPVVARWLEQQLAQVPATISVS